MQVATFAPRESKKNIGSYRRDKSFWKELSLIDLDKGRDIVTVRFYGNGDTVYCVAWLHLWDYSGLPEGISDCGPGMGKAGGYGYHKASAAMQEALHDLGMTFSENIHGRGDSVMCDALLALAAYVGVSRPFILAANA